MERVARGGVSAAVAAVLAVCLVVRVEAQSAASVVGTVFGPDGARLPGVLITLTEGDGDTMQVVAGEQGAYRISRVRPGVNRLRAALQGFRSAEVEVDVADGSRTVVDFRLMLDSLSEAVTVVGSAERQTVEPPRIRESAARDVGEALAALAGVWKVRRGAVASDIVVRGYQNDNVTVLIDGARLYGACPNNMDHTAFHVDFAEVERIEIGKGPFDLRNQGGLGAAVNIVTKRPAQGFHLDPQVSFGSFGFVNPSVTASYGTPRAAVLAGYSYRVANGYRDGSGRPFLGTANYRSSSADTRAFDVNTAWARVDLARGTTQDLQVGYTRQRAGRVLYPYLQMDAVYDNADRVNLGYDLKRRVGPVQAVRVQGYLTRVEHWMTDADRVSSNGMTAGYSMATMARTDTLGGKVEAVVPGGTLGIEVYRRGWDAKTELAMMKYQPQASIPNVHLTSAGLYGEFSRALGEAVRLEWGGRIDRTANAADPAAANSALYQVYHGVSRTTAVDTYPSGKIRLVYHPASSLTLSGGVGHTVRVPDPQERYFGLRRSGSDWVGNPLLQPTKNTGVELNAAYRAGRLFLNGTVHRDALADAVSVYEQPRMQAGSATVNSVARSFRNVDATLSGAEIEAVLPVTDRLFVAGDFSAVRGRQHADPAAIVEAGWLAEMPPMRGRLALRYEWRGQGRRSGFAEVETVYSARQTHVDADLKESPTPPYSVTNLRVGGGAGPVRLTVGVANLFNRTYFEHLSYQRDPFRLGTRVFEPGRNFYVNLGAGF